MKGSRVRTPYSPFETVFSNSVILYSLKIVTFSQNCKILFIIIGFWFFFIRSPFPPGFSRSPSAAGARDLRLLQAATKMLQLDRMRFFGYFWVHFSIRDKLIFTFNKILPNFRLNKTYIIRNRKTKWNYKKYQIWPLVKGSGERIFLFSLFCGRFKKVLFWSINHFFERFLSVYCRLIDLWPWNFSRIL